MGLTVAGVTERQSLGNYFEKIVDITFDSSYPTGGESFAAADVGFSSILTVSLSNAGGFVFEYVASTGKIKAYWVDTTTDGAVLAEVADTTDLSAITTRAVVRGRG